MPYNPTLPVNGALVLAAELRDQFNGLKAIIDTQAATIATLQTQVNNLQASLANYATTTDLANAIAGTANSTNGVADLPGFVASDPPLQSDVQAIADKVNELINTSHR